MIVSANQFHAGTCYRVTGDLDHNPTIVLVHGVGLSQDIWARWVELLSPKYAVVTYDFLGHGDTVNLPGPRKLSDFRDQVHALIDYLGVDKVHLVGFSLGALTAQAFAMQYGEKLHSLTLLHSVFKRSAEQISAIEARYEITRDQGPLATVELAIQRWFSDQWIQDNPDYIEFVRDLFRQHTDDGYLKAYRVFCDADNELDPAGLESVRCPSLAITGSLEPGSLPEMSEQLARVLGGQVIINQDHLHMAPVEHADLLATQVEKFIQSVVTDG